MPDIISSRCGVGDPVAVVDGESSRSGRRRPLLSVSSDGDLVAADPGKCELSTRPIDAPDGEAETAGGSRGVRPAETRSGW
jgi:hypothetical protein